jgi:hypothetical protein
MVGADGAPQDPAVGTINMDARWKNKSPRHFRTAGFNTAPATGTYMFT